MTSARTIKILRTVLKHYDECIAGADEASDLSDRFLYHMQALVLIASLPQVTLQCEMESLVRQKLQQLSEQAIAVLRTGSNPEEANGSIDRFFLLQEGYQNPLERLIAEL